MRTYSLEIITTRGTQISIEDFEKSLAAVGDLGADAVYWEVEINSFRLETEEFIDTQLLSRSFELVDQVDACHVRLESAS